MAVQSASLELVRAAKDGDNLAFESLVEPLLDKAYRLAWGMLHDSSAAEDAVQEAAFKAWRKLSTLRDGADMRPWFLAIVANECRMALRTRWWGVIRGAMPDPRAESPESAVIQGLEIRDAIRRMAPPKRLIIVLHWYLDLPSAEIAAVLGISVHSAESRLVRATRELKNRMEANSGRP